MRHLKLEKFGTFDPLPASGGANAEVERARALRAAGDVEGAKQAYLRVLRTDPEDSDALNALGALAFETGHRSAARTAFAQAVRANPHEARGHANLAMVLADDGDEDGAREHFDAALRAEPDHRGAHLGLAILLWRRGAYDAARAHARAGSLDRADAWPFRGDAKPMSLVLVVSAVGPNVPIDPFIDDRVFQKWTIVAEFFDPKADLPPHDLVFHGIGEADRCLPALDAAASLLSRTHARVLNPPSRVRETGRSANAKRFAQIPSVVTARTEEWPRPSLAAEDAPAALARAGFTWPLLLRSPGFHGGEHVVKVDRPEELPPALADLPGTTLFVIQFLDTRGVDRKFRKFRVMIVDGQVYPLHLAVSSHWKVHYFSADMAEQPEHRAEDEAFLEDMPQVLGAPATRALSRIRETLGLDYGGIDFALDRDRNVIVFEANASMTIVPAGDDPRWRYRVAPVERVRRAVRRMLSRAAGAPLEGDDEGTD